MAIASSPAEVTRAGRFLAGIYVLFGCVYTVMLASLTSSLVGELSTHS